MSHVKPTGGLVCNEREYHNRDAHHIRIENKECNKVLKAVVQRITVMTERKLDIANSNFSQAIIHILNLLKKITMFHCFL